MGQENINIICAKGLHKSYKSKVDPVLNNLSIEVKKGEFYGILGPNGVGKTTFMNILCGLIKPSNGEVSVLGQKPSSFSDANKIGLGVVPQDIALYDKLSGRENLLFFGSAYKIPMHILKSKIDYYTNLFGLETAIDRQVSTYSGGMKRRVNLMAAILHEPELLFLDEPTVGIDVQSKLKIVEFLKEYNSSGKTIFYTSHHMREAESLCTKVGIMDMGNLVVEGSPKELMNSYSCQSLEEVFLLITGKHLRDDL